MLHNYVATAQQVIKSTKIVWTQKEATTYTQPDNYSVILKIPPQRPAVFWHFLTDIFWQTVENFRSIFYTLIISSYLR